MWSADSGPMNVIVIGGSGSKVGKTTLACHLIRRAALRGSVAGLKISTQAHRHQCELSMYAQPAGASNHDTDRYLLAGADVALLLDAGVDNFRTHLAAGLRTARTLRPLTLIIESTSAGAELSLPHDSWFVAGTTPWKPAAGKHFERAAHIVEPHELRIFAHAGAAPMTRTVR